MSKKLLYFLFLPVLIMIQEVFSHIYIFGFDISILTVAVFSLFIGCALNTLFSLLKGKALTITGVVFFCISGFLYSFYIVYCRFFHTFFSWSTVSLAGDLTQFRREIIGAIIQSLPGVIMMYVPLVLFVVFCRRVYEYKEKKLSLSITALSALLCIFTFLFNSVDISAQPSEAFKKYGIAFSGAWDAVCVMTNAEVAEVINPYVIDGATETETEHTEEVIEYNITDINFDYLIENTSDDIIKDMHEYFSSVPPTNKNEYTGLFKGKNLIFLCLEGFSDKVIDESLTPVLYKMYNEGFKFTRFYNSLWGGSTATGEYAVMTGNFYSKANCISNSSKTNQYYSMGNIFKREGYATYAYHNHSYTYYDRHKSHPNFGYDVYKAVGNGLELTKDLWPNSDEEMAVKTIDEYIDSQKPFHVYYMTVSGHAFYNWGGNNMSKRNREYFDQLDYSEGVKAYFACQYEVEKMLEVLCTRLEEKGILENTVFAMCADHYPYALEDEELGELYGMDAENIRSDFDLYKNAFILWTPDMERVEIDKPCSSYDIVPTLANLFGVNYDSRLITGRDILSDGENIAVINLLENGTSWNWVTEKGEYDVYTETFTPYVEMNEEEQISYKENTQKKVDAMRNYSFKILDNNYYSYIYN